MKTKLTFADFMRHHVPAYFRNLPDSVRIPALDGARPDDVVRPLEDATLDDLAFAIQGLESESHELLRRLRDLRDLYELARKRGALGATTLGDAFRTFGDDKEAGK